jgi:hypothetical protein
MCACLRACVRARARVRAGRWVGGACVGTVAMDGTDLQQCAHACCGALLGLGEVDAAHEVQHLGVRCTLHGACNMLHVAC